MHLSSALSIAVAFDAALTSAVPHAKRDGNEGTVERYKTDPNGPIVTLESLGLTLADVPSGPLEEDTTPSGLFPRSVSAALASESKELSKRAPSSCDFYTMK